MILLAFLDSFPIVFNFLANRINVTLIYSVTICEQKEKDCARSGSFQHKTALLFSTLMFAGFHNLSLLC